MVADFKDKINISKVDYGTYRCQWFKIDLADNTVKSYAEDIVSYLDGVLRFIRIHFSEDEDIAFKAVYNLIKYKEFHISEEY